MKRKLPLIFLFSICIILSGCFFFAPPEEIIDTTREFSFEYECNDYNIELDLAKNHYEYYHKQLKDLFYSKESYYNSFVNDEYDEVAINRLIEKIKTAINTEDNDEIAIAAISLVQRLTYDCEKYNEYLKPTKSTKFKTNFPYETLYEQKGVCGDSTILLGKILKQLGYGLSFMLYTEERHIAIGLKCDDKYSDYGSGYCYIETTGPSRFGVRPKTLNLTSVDIIKISEGNIFSKSTEIKKTQESLVDEFGENILDVSTCNEIKYFKQLKNISDIKDELNEKIISSKTSLGIFYNTTVKKEEKDLLKTEQELTDKKEELDAKKKEHADKQTEFYAAYCDKITIQSQYEKCLELQKEIGQITKEYNTCVEEYNYIINKYNEEYKEYSDIFIIYNENYNTYSSYIDSYNQLITEYNTNVELYNLEAEKHYSSCEIANTYKPTSEENIDAEDIKMLDSQTD